MPDRKRRILLGVTSDQSIRLLDGFPDYLARQGWDVHVVSSAGHLSKALAARSGVSVHSIEMAREPSPVNDLRALVQWVRLLRRVRPDVTSVGTPKAGLLGGLAGWISRVPFRVYHLRGMRLEALTGVRRSLLAALERLSVRTAHRVLVVSPSLRDLSVSLGVLRPGKAVVLGDGSSNGVDLARHVLTPQLSSRLAELAGALGLAPSVPVIGFVGRLTEDKGTGVLADALAIVDAAGHDYQLLLVGGGDGASGDHQLARLRGNGRRVAATGQVDDPEVYYHLMTFLCLPTLREGFPNVVLEAAASGRPSVTTDATGAVDSVVDGITGLIADAGSASSLAVALQAMLTDPGRAATMGAAARERAAELYSRERVWSLTDDFYRSAGAPR